MTDKPQTTTGLKVFAFLLVNALATVLFLAIAVIYWAGLQGEHGGYYAMGGMFLGVLFYSWGAINGN